MKNSFLLCMAILCSSFCFACNSNLTVSITPTSDIICAGDTAVLCATQGFAAYNWNTGGIGVCIYASFAGNYNVTATDNNNCTAVSNTASIQNYAPTPVTISVNGDTLTTFGGGTYQWFLNGSPVPGATDAIFIAMDSGSYVVAITNNNGCTGVSSNVTMNIPVTASLGADQNVCAGTIDTLSANAFGGQSPYTFTWSSTGDALSCQSCANPVITITESCTVTVTVTDANNATTMASVSYVLSSDAGSLSLNPDNGLALCIGHTGVLSASGGFTSYQWSTGATGSSITVDSAGVYAVTATKSGCSATGSATVTAIPLPAAQTITGAMSITPLQGYGYQVNNMQGITYNWTALNGTVTSGQGTNSAIIAWNADGPYVVGLIETNIAGCSSTDTLSVMVTSIAQTSSVGADVYSYYLNGANIIHVNIGQPIVYGLKLYEISGRIVMNVPATAANQIIVPDNLAKGIYVVEIGANNLSAHSKVIIR